MENSILSEVDDTSILRTGLSTPLSLSRLAIAPSAHAPAQRAGAQRLCALARSVEDRGPALCSDLGHCGHAVRIAEPSSLTPCGLRLCIAARSASVIPKGTTVGSERFGEPICRDPLLES